MAQITITSTPEEQAKVIEALKTLQGKTVAVSEIATVSNLAHSRVRYAIMDLLEADKIERVATKAINKHYVRYSYIVRE